MSKKKKENKKQSANYKLEKEQLFELNREFYNNYMSNYFLLKTADIVDKISNSNSYIEYLKGKTFKIDKVSFTADNLENSELQSYGKIELMDTYYHVLECLIRTFVAHAKMKQCPWIEMSELSTQKYKNCIKKIANSDFSWLNNELDSDITVLYTITGHKDISVISREDLDGLKLWLSWSANELLNHKEHNSYKHGLTLFTKHQNFSINNTKGKLIEYSGDTICTLQIEEKPNRYVWTKVFKSIKCDEYISMMCSLLQRLKIIMCPHSKILKLLGFRIQSHT